jgi:hypothetical protein
LQQEIVLPGSKLQKELAIKVEFDRKSWNPEGVDVTVTAPGGGKLKDLYEARLIVEEFGGTKAVNSPSPGAPPQMGLFLVNARLERRSPYRRSSDYEITFTLKDNALNRSWLILRCGNPLSEVQYILQLGLYAPK